MGQPPPPNVIAPSDADWDAARSEWIDHERPICRPTRGARPRIAPGSAQKREAVNVTSARAHARRNCASARSASAALP
jgi:hypothetical protein